MNSIDELVSKVREEITNRDIKISQLNNTIENMYKALAKIKIDLDRSLRGKKDVLNNAIAAVELARSVTPYHNYSTGQNTIDQPYSEEEKSKILE